MNENNKESESGFQWQSVLGMFGLFIFLIIINVVRTCESEPDKSDEYYQQYDIKLKGIVVRSSKIDDRHECYKIKVISSNTKSHDIRGNGGKYFLYINNDVAFFMWAHLEITDTIYIDYGAKDFYVITNSGKKHQQNLPGFGDGYRSLVRCAEAYME